MQREAWLHAECDDENLRQDVVELLKYDDENSFFEKPLISPPDIDATRSYQPKTESTSKLFAGRYKLLQTLGEGASALSIWLNSSIRCADE